MTKCLNSLSSPRPYQQQKFSENPYPNVPTADEIQKAVQSAKTADEMLEVFLHMASLNVAVDILVEGQDPDKILSFASRALNILDRDEKPTIAVVVALRLMGSATYGLNRFDESLGYLTRAHMVLSRLQEEGLNMECIWPLFLMVHRELSRVNMAMGRREDALQYLRNCSEVTDLDEPKEAGNANYDLADAYVDVFSYEEALPFCLKALEIHQNQFGHVSEEVLQDRLLLCQIYTELFDYQKAFEQNELLQKVMENLGLSSELLCREIHAAELNTYMGKYDEVLVVLKRVLPKTDKKSEDRAQVLIPMAAALLSQQNIVDANRCLKTACVILDNGKIEKTVKVAEAYVKMALLHENMKEYELAISLFKKSLTILWKQSQEQQYFAALVRASLGRTLLRFGKVEEAIFHMERAGELMKESIGPKHIGLRIVYKYLGVAYLMLRRSEPAAQMFSALKYIVEANSISIEACQTLLKAYDTVESCEVAIEKQDRVVSLFERRGYSAQDEMREARRQLEKLMERAQVASLDVANLVLRFVYE